MNPSIIKITEDNSESLANDINATREFDHEFMKTHDMEQSERFVCKTLFQHSPMIYTPGPQKESIGTSIYIVFNQRKYILTAGHLFTNGKPATYKKQERIDLSNVYIGNNVRLLDFNRGLIFPPAEDNDYHEMDYALFLVNDEISRVLERVYLPFPITTTKRITAYYPQYGFLYGYPCSKNKHNRFSKNTDTDLCIRAPLDLDSLKSGNNIIFRCDRDKASTLNEMRNKQTKPHNVQNKWNEWMRNMGYYELSNRKRLSQLVNCIMRYLNKLFKRNEKTYRPSCLRYYRVLKTINRKNYQNERRQNWILLQG